MSLETLFLALDRLVQALSPAWPYFTTIATIWLLHKLFGESVRDFVRLFLTEVKDLLVLKPSLGAINFMGVLVGAAIVFVFLTMDMFSAHDAAAGASIDHGANSAADKRRGLEAVLIVFFFLFILLSIKISQGDRKK